MSNIEKETAFVVFEVINDKDRGNLALTIKPHGLDTLFFFKYHHQPIDQHPEQIQRIVQRSKPTSRKKSIKINIMPFLNEYWNVSGKFFEFKSIKLNSTSQQLAKVQERRINKEIGMMKRKNTLKEAKDRKILAENKKIRDKLDEDEAAFQVERARRIAAAMKDMQAMQN